MPYCPLPGVKPRLEAAKRYMPHRCTNQTFTQWVKAA
jgi:hypothetical protein